MGGFGLGEKWTDGLLLYQVPTLCLFSETETYNTVYCHKGRVTLFSP